MLPIGSYSSIAQRAVHTYIRALTHCVPTPVGQHALYQFFQNFYAALYAHPEQFGLPITPDGCYTAEQTNDTNTKSDLTKRIKRPKEIISAGVDFLRALGREGTLRDDALVLPALVVSAYLKRGRTSKVFLNGLAQVGLRVESDGTVATVRHEAGPEMLLALKELALACEAVADPNMRAFHFARCDLRALDAAFQPDAADLYAYFDADDCAHALEMHQFFVSKGFKVIIKIHDVSVWVVQYQGKREIKSSPLYQVDFDERHVTPMMVQIKAASTNRLVPVLADEPRWLQEDFYRRAYRCNGSKCDWCRNKTTLRPTTIEHDGKVEVLCWYSNSTVPELNETSMELIRQYARVHEKLAQAR